MRTHLLHVITTITLLFSAHIYANQHYVISTINKQDINAKEKYSIDVHYPQLNTQHLDKSAQDFNAIIRDRINNKMELFKKDVEDFNKIAKDSKQSSGSSRLQIKNQTTIVMVNHNPIVSVRMIVDTYFISTPYPNTNHITLNYDLHQNKVIKLKEVFKPDVDYIESINQYCGNVLTKKTGLTLQEIERIMSPLTNWNIQANGLLFTFDEFPHALGPQEVHVNYSMLNNLLASEFRSR